MDQDKINTIKNWLKKSEITFDEAKTDISNNVLFGAQNRLYYSIFYSVVALGYFKGFITSSHSELLGWFNKNFIKTGIFSIELAKTYKNSSDNRHKSDYTITFEPSVEELDSSLEEAKVLSKQSKTILKTIFNFFSKRSLQFNTISISGFDSNLCLSYTTFIANVAT